MDSGFQASTSRVLGQVESKVDGVIARLDKINGSIARNDARIGVLEGKDQARDARDAANRTWRDSLSPVAKLLMAFFVGLVLANAPKMLQLMGGK